MRVLILYPLTVGDDKKKNLRKAEGSALKALEQQLRNIQRCSMSLKRSFTFDDIIMTS